ncbi:MAG: hypothetical protein POELPBGB_03315 [Bacteroidia bacterium]|nr:hypothetical protein [Bacteroidia bacterium]
MIIRNKFIFAFLCFWVCINSARAQELVQTVRGRVIDAESRAGLPGATVAITTLNPVAGTATDIDGYFRFEKIPVGRHDIKVNYMGYKEQFLSQVLVGSGKEIVLEIMLEETVKKLEEVVISGTSENGEAVNEMAVISARSFSVEQTGKFAATGDDPARMALSFAGVSTQDDLFNEIVIRGNSPRGLLWKLEGVEIPNPNHLSQEGGNGGAVSMLSNNVLGASDFLTGAFPAEYGNASSGVFDLRMKKGNNEKREYAIQLGTLGLEAAVEGPFVKGKKSSYLINYRYSTLAVIEATGYKITGDIRIGFQDINYNFFFPTKKAGAFTVFGVGGLSWSKLDDQNTYNKIPYNERNLSGYNMGATGLTHTFSFNDKTWIKTVVSASGYQVSNSWNVEENGQYKEYWKQNVSNYYYRAATQINSKLNAKNSLRGGALFNVLNFLKLEENVYWQTQYRYLGTTSFTQAYLQWKHRFTEQLSLVSGMHFSYFALNKSAYPEPRLGLTWQAAPRHMFSIGAGLHSRLEPLGTYLIPFTYKKDTLTNSHLTLTRAFHAVAGHTTKLSKTLTLKTEIYFQYLFNVPIDVKGKKYYSTINEDDSYQSELLQNNGHGKNYGIELTLDKRLAGKWYLLSTVSLYESLYMGRNGVWGSTRFNGNFITNLTAGKDFAVGKKKNDLFSVNMRLFWAGGRRYAPYDIEQSIEDGDEVRIYKNGYTDRASNFFRLDAGISFRKNKPRWAWIIKLDIQNVTNRPNEVTRRLDIDKQEVRTISHLGMLPALKYRVEF